MSELREMLRAAFQDEHKEYLEGMRIIISKLEETGGSVSDSELAEVFRQAHSLKAAARVCDFAFIEKLGHQLETFFGRVRKGSLHPGKEALAIVRDSLSRIEDWALALAEKRDLPEPAQTLQENERLLSGAAAPKAELPVRDELTLKLMAAFQIEHKEHLEEIRLFLAEVEQGKSSAEHVDDAFRRAHSLKGAARIAELHSASALAHRLETLFSRVRDKSLQLGPKVIRAIYLVLDAIEDEAACAARNESAPETAQARAAIEDVLGEVAKDFSQPVISEKRSADGPGSRDEHHAVANRQDRVAAPGARNPEVVRVSAANLDKLLRSSEQLLEETLRQNIVSRDLADLSKQIEGLEKEWNSLRRGNDGELRILAAAPGLERVNRYLLAIEIQVHSLGKVARTVRRTQQRSSWALKRLGKQLQQDARRVRMVTAESIFQVFRKMVRDQARDENKEVDFRVHGFEITADRVVLQALKDPLMHILCNAVTHGIEVPQERRESGKSDAGRVVLQLETLGNRLLVRIEDDGRGLDLRKIAENAVKRGLLSENEARNCPPAELARLIFRPGFTTSRTVTGLSGRGMGLSVVYEETARLQGEVDVLTKDGPGTCVALSVPLSISTQRLLLVCCRAQTFGIPVHAIERLVRVKMQELESIEGRPMLMLDSQPIPVAELAHLLDMKDDDGENPEAKAIAMAILRSGSRRVAVRVDDFLAERDSFIKTLDDPAARITKLSGGILMEDGSIALVINPVELLKDSSIQSAARVKRVAPPVKKTPIVLVVDDSLTTRTLERSILEAHGFVVRIAVDGLEALKSLRLEPVDLVITDVQMPHMDGFQLLEEIKKDPRLARTPVIVVTSLGKREDQERGMALGADAYIVKRKFDHQELLDTIRQIL